MKARMKQNGFTLVEMLIVLVILATLAAIVVPSMADKGTRARIVAAGTQMQQMASALSEMEIAVGRFPTTGEGLIALMETGPEITGPINIGNPNEFTVRELAEQVIRLTNATSEIIEAPLPQDDPRQRRPDIGRARQQLKWQPAVSLREGLLRTIEHFDGLLSAPRTRMRAARASSNGRLVSMANGQTIARGQD